jgi:hypothetical protein
MTRDLEEGSVIRGAVQVGSFAIPFGPITLGSSIEWAFEPERIAELRAVSQQTGGRGELVELSTAWLRPPRVMEASLRLPLGIALLALLIVEALLTRTDWKFPTWQPVGNARRAKKIKVKKVAVDPLAPAPLDIAREEKPVFREEVPDETSRRSRFQKAKDRK